MMRNRGLSFEELQAMDEELFEYFYIFDQFVERDDQVLEQYRHAQQCDLMVKVAGCKDSSMYDFDMANLIGKPKSNEISTESEQSKVNTFVSFIKSQTPKSKVKSKPNNKRGRNGK